MRDPISAVGKRAGKVVSIDSRPRLRDKVKRGTGEATLVTQARLAEGLHLHLEEMRVAQALRDFRLKIEADLAADSQVESGDLLYDVQLKIVRRNVKNAIVRR